MLKALTIRERRLMLGILAILLLGAMVKWWRWQARKVEKFAPVDQEQVARIGRGSGGGTGSSVVSVGGEFPTLAA